MIAAEKSDARLEFTYDYRGRRVEKKVYAGSTGNWTLSKHLKFVYNGYKLIEELDGANSDAILRKYVWGGKIPLSIYDAGNTATYYYFTDANKNVGQLIDNSGNIVAKYEYSPFGKIVFQGGTYTDNPIRFSSEYYDSETDLIYYNYRYYSPELGRWISRDPIEEEGGWNLYGMVNNNPINWIDYLGLDCPCDHDNGTPYLDAAIATIEGFFFILSLPLSLGGCTPNTPEDTQILTPDPSEDDDDLPTLGEDTEEKAGEASDLVTDASESTSQVNTGLDPLDEVDTPYDKLGLANELKDLYDISTTENSEDASLKSAEFLSSGVWPKQINPAKLMREKVLPGIGSNSKK